MKNQVKWLTGKLVFFSVWNLSVAKNLSWTNFDQNSVLQKIHFFFFFGWLEIFSVTHWCYLYRLKWNTLHFLLFTSLLINYQSWLIQDMSRNCVICNFVLQVFMICLCLKVKYTHTHMLKKNLWNGRESMGNPLSLILTLINLLF